jgi:ABC-type nitrate/sulfonate/bicarbonate transport system ATPase subunit
VQGNVEFGLEELATATAERKARAARFIAMTGLGFMKRVIPLKSIVDTSFVEEAARAVPEQ